MVAAAAGVDIVVAALVGVPAVQVAGIVAGQEEAVDIVAGVLVGAAAGIASK